VVILLIDKKCGDGNNQYYSEYSHSKPPRYDEKPPHDAPFASHLAETFGNTSTAPVPNDSKLVRLDCVAAKAKTATRLPRLRFCNLPAHSALMELSHEDRTLTFRTVAL
jgi:hypothetical protein